jgi:DNA-binding NarL/FixJ family response regulator
MRDRPRRRPRSEIRSRKQRDVRVFVFSEHPLYRELLANVFQPGSGFRVVGVANEWNQAGADLAQCRADVLLLDLHTQLRRPLEAAAESVHRSPANPLAALARPYGLTIRELEITRNIVSGLANKDIAAQCGISEKTVKHHLTSIFQKVGVTTRLELTVFAFEHHLAGSGDRGDGNSALMGPSTRSKSDV